MEGQVRLVSVETMARLKALPSDLRAVIIPKALTDASAEIHAGIMDNLSGSQSNTGLGANMRSESPGSYPVPVVTGHLRRSQRRNLPGKSGLTNEQVAFFNTAQYSAVIHDGLRGNSPRAFIDDAVAIKESAVEAAFIKRIEAAT